MTSHEIPNCPRCGQPGECDDQWQRQYACYCGGNKRVFQPEWYKEQSRKYCEAMDAAETQEERLRIIEAGQPWNACNDKDLSKTAAYQANLKQIKEREER